jgi:tartrate dehydratase beta subunit/fumarate hydratase class I family protein
VKRLTIENLPIFTAIDSLGNSIFQQGRAAYAQK